MKRWLAVLLSLLLLLPTPSLADERDDAIEAARIIMRLFGEHRYRDVWQNYTSDFIRQRGTRDSFLAHMSMSRTQLGALSQSRVVDVQFFTQDAASGFVGRIYAVMFANTYSIGPAYDRIVVVKEADGRFRLSGFHIAPGSQ